MRARSERAGFTLIEMLAVLLILSILMAFLVKAIGGGQKIIELENTRAFLQEIGGRCAEYNEEHGNYPASTFPADMDPRPTKTNMGSEMLVIELWKKGAAWQAAEIGEERLGNTDDDSTKTSLTSFASPDAFELVDGWGNPIVYIHRKDYDKEVTYVTIDPEGAVLETPVKGFVSPKTGDPYRKTQFQLVSAGPDGEFGTLDDVANFEIEE